MGPDQTMLESHLLIGVTDFELKSYTRQIICAMILGIVQNK